MNLKIRTRLPACVLAAVLGLGALPATAGTPAAGPARDALAMHKSFVALYNEQRWDEVLDFYATDAIAVPPNHDLVRGNRAILELNKTARPLLGEMESGHEPHAVITSGDLTTILGNYVFTNGLRFTTTEVYQRQADGRYKCKLDQFGSRDPLP